MRAVHLVILSLFAHVAPDAAQDPAAIGRCAVNRNSGVPVGKIIAIETNPATGVRSYRVQDFDNPRSLYYMRPSTVRVVDCSSAKALDEERDRLVGQCAYNPSDRKYLGRVVLVGPEGMDSSDRPAPGQRAVTIYHPEYGTMKLTYPKYLIVRPCSETELQR